jgi:iron-sulfur cluster assembly accessory protein
MGFQGAAVTLTDHAVSRLRDIMTAENKQAWSLRIALVRTHCMGGRGYTYRLELEESPSRDDQVFEDKGVTVSIDPVSVNHLNGAEMDYVEGPEGSGFTLNNPNVIARCPCGHHDIFE